MRWDRQQQMDMIPVYRPGMNNHLMAQRNFPQQLPGAKADIPAQNCEPILRHPHNVVFAVPHRMTARLRRLHRRMLMHPAA
jgi:hypothetical protein